MRDEFWRHLDIIDYYPHFAISMLVLLLIGYVLQ